MPQTDLVDVNEAARLTGLNQQTIYRLARRGRIRSFTVLKRAVRFERSEVLLLVAERSEQPMTPEAA
ncbi:MAG: helix-turn-helix domain-containing protein [Vicinamibacterales bacterium]